MTSGPMDFSIFRYSNHNDILTKFIQQLESLLVAPWGSLHIPVFLTWGADLLHCVGGLEWLGWR
jgi:hypothetical protein